jgi:Flp pilus assembly pilin Flp
MRKLMLKLWSDDAGIVALEYLLVATILGLGLVVGLSALEAGLNAELGELGNAALALSQGYSVWGQHSFSGGSGTVLGSKRGFATVDTPGNNFETLTAPREVTNINVIP